MIEIQHEDLVVGKVYYIESRQNSCFTATKTKTKQKGVFKMFVPARIDMDYVYFDNVENTRRSDPIIAGCSGSQGFPIDFYKFYLCEKDAIEKSVTNRILKEITEDYTFEWL